MTNNEAISRFEKLTYELAKCVGKLNDIKHQMEYVNDKMNWDGMFLCDFGEALEKLANVESGAVIYTLEEKYRDSDIDEMRQSLKAYENHE